MPVYADTAVGRTHKPAEAAQTRMLTRRKAALVQGQGALGHWYDALVPPVGSPGWLAVDAMEPLWTCSPDELSEARRT